MEGLRRCFEGFSNAIFGIAPSKREAQHCELPAALRSTCLGYISNFCWQHSSSRCPCCCTDCCIDRSLARAADECSMGPTRHQACQFFSRCRQASEGPRKGQRQGKRPGIKPVATLCAPTLSPVPKAAPKTDCSMAKAAILGCCVWLAAGGWLWTSPQGEEQREGQKPTVPGGSPGQPQLPKAASPPKHANFDNRKRQTGIYAKQQGFQCACRVDLSHGRLLLPPLPPDQQVHQLQGQAPAGARTKSADLLQDPGESSPCSCCGTPGSNQSGRPFPQV